MGTSESTKSVKDTVAVPVCDSFTNCPPVIDQKDKLQEAVVELEKLSSNKVGSPELLITVRFPVLFPVFR